MNARSRRKPAIRYRPYWSDSPIDDQLDERERAEEDVFFRRKDRQLLARMQIADDEQRRSYVRELAHMRCPECARPLVAVRCLGIDVPECPVHHGMWLTEEQRRVIAKRERYSWLSRYLYAMRSPANRPRRPLIPS